jgi:hypothetical protein
MSIIHNICNNDISYTNLIIFKNKIFNNDSKTFHLYEQNIKDPIITDCLCNIKNNIMEKIIRKYNFVYNENCEIANITNMNEIYVSVIGGGGSDNVFETPHIDGPFYWLPFCKVYRCIFAITPNKLIKTIFITPGEKGNNNLTSTSYILNENQFLAFDYNRDIHYIEKINGEEEEEETKENNNTNRVVLKLHYIIYPTFLPYILVEFYKMIHVYYNTFMRFLFLKSQSKNNKWLSFIINTCTVYYSALFM